MKVRDIFLTFCTALNIISTSAAKNSRISTRLGPKQRKLRDKRSKTSMGSCGPARIGGWKSETNLVDRCGKSAWLHKINGIKHKKSAQALLDLQASV
nr:hypothetical protein [Afipia felis]